MRVIVVDRLTFPVVPDDGTGSLVLRFVNRRQLQAFLLGFGLCFALTS